ncbi:MAG: hypothetical protein C5B54_03755 [Acidobacteria bacterium]|nr:MAG: hypothetical protein C5B54_03755 [Acidobacteriota bacterium]
MFYKPDSVKAKGGIPVPGPGGQKEDLLNSWMDVISKNNLKINDEETCKAVKQENGVFKVSTEKGKTKEQVEYTAKTVILAIGGRGAPMKLGAPGEDMSVVVNPGFSCPNCGSPRVAGRGFCSNCGQKFDPKPTTPFGYCTECGTKRIDATSPCEVCEAKPPEKQPAAAAAPKSPERLGTMEFSMAMLKQMAAEKKKEEEGKKCLECNGVYKDPDRFCTTCGSRIYRVPLEPINDSRVKYKLSNPDDYTRKKCIVVGGGNSAIEAAVDLCGFKRVGERFIFVRDNDVTLIVRSDFKGDLKLGNKINVYDCMDSGKLKVMFGAAIKDVTETEAVVINVKTKQEMARLQNDYIFALIGGEKPTKFLEGIGIKIG